MSEPTEPITDEMISAYLDGELSADERRRVEQAMVQDPRYGRLLQQYESLRDALRELPTQRLDEGFADRVLLRIAELPIGHVNSPAPSRAADASAQSSGEATIVSRRASMPQRSPGVWQRRLIWPTLVVAAAVVVMLLTPDAGREGRQVVSVIEQKDAAPTTTVGDSKAARPSQRAVQDRLEWRMSEPAGVENDSDRRARLLESIGELPEQEGQEGSPRGIQLERLAESRSAVTPQGAERPIPQRDEAAPAVEADADFAPIAPVVLQAEVTTEQLTGLIAQLRRDQIPIVSTTPTNGLGTTTVLDRSGGASGERANESLSVAAPSAMRAVVLQAPLAEVQASLARAKVQSEQIDRRGLERFDVNSLREASAQVMEFYDLAPAEVPPISVPTPSDDVAVSPSPSRSDASDVQAPSEPEELAPRLTAEQGDQESEIVSANATLANDQPAALEAGVRVWRTTGGRVVLFLKIVDPASSSTPNPGAAPTATPTQASPDDAP